MVTNDDASRQAAQRAMQMQRAWRHYSGNPPKPLTVRMGEPDDNIILSFARLIVDKGTSFLFGQDVTSEVPGGGGAQAWLDECWRRNQRGLTLQKLATNGGVTGHAFAKLIPGKPYPRVVVLDSQCVDVVCSDDDIDDIAQYTISMPAVDGETRRQLVTPTDAGWQIVDQAAESGDAWRTTRTAPWPYAFSPIVDCQNLPQPNEFWGVPDLVEDVLAILGSINRVVSHLSKIIRVHAHPKTWSRGLGNKVLRIGIDDVINLPSETAELHNLEMQSDLSSSMGLLNKLIDALSWVTRVPTVAFGLPDAGGALSGVALQIRYQPLLEKTETKRRTYGYLVQELDRRLLALAGFGDTTVTQLHWPELLPSDPLQERQAYILDDSLGVSTETILTKLGYDPEIEATRRSQETAAKQAAYPQLPIVPAPIPIGAPAPDVAKGA